MTSNVSLKDKFLGCIAGAHIGSAMGAAVEGWSYQKIEETYGTVDRPLSYEHYNNGWKREPGTTEDGIERQKLMITAIIEKQDRVNAEDVKNIWVRDIKPISIGMVSEPFEATLLAMAKSGIPARDLGKYCDYAGLNSFARSCHPIGLINAGDVKGAIEDVLEVGQLYQTSNSRGLKWASVTAVSIAAATKPNATVDSVIGAIYDNCDQDLVVKEIDRELKHTANCTDFRELRVAFDDVYSGKGTPYAFASANEVVTKGICIFRMVKGNLKEAMISGVNFGRDIDCITAVASGISGSLTGISSLPDEWIKQTDHATSVNIYTNSQRTIKETADGLFDAYQARLSKMQNFVKEMAVFN
ncbi:hypothetical protein CJ195_16805 [Bacillus sp. UMB0899]|uniref:ADP-ribosylglycohydrolase family protein n=1 Tax=Metabacillus schmidteae TaxID=2730405 RepID=UPI000C8009BE|nr:ADP-ribosylglycohydrolase family protein [Metabacillus schmidteae]PMC35918.1 hypothetical protein CJ195_16805 [Bacillus sp. UMB0899]